MKLQFMNRALSLVAILFVSGSSCAMTQYEPVEVQSVINVPSQDQRVIYNKARQWFSQHFVSGESVIDYENPVEGTIVGNGVANIGPDPFRVSQYNIKYTVRVDTKDGKFRVLTEIHEHTTTDYTGRIHSANHITDERRNDAINHVAKIVSNLESYVNTEKLVASSDW